MSQSRHLLAFVITIFALTSCAERQNKHYAEETIDGVKYIHNLFPKFHNAPQFQLDFVGQIGSLEEEDENYQFFRAIDATIDNEGNIYVLDSGNYRVQVFDSDQKYIHTLGSQGTGPGEFQNIVSLDVAHNGDIYVLGGKGYIHHFGSDGSFIKSSKSNGYYSSMRITGTDIFTAPLVNLNNPGFAKKSSQDLNDEVTARTLVSVDITNNTKEEFGTGFAEDPVWGGALVNAIAIETDENYNLYATFRHQNKIEKYSSDGQLILSIFRPLNFPIKHSIGMRTWTSGKAEKKWEAFDPVSVSENIGIDDHGRIWIVTYDTQPIKDEGLTVIERGKRIFEVFNQEGILLTHIPYPDERLTFVRMKGDKMLFIDHDRVSVHKYRVADLQE